MTEKIGAEALSRAAAAIGAGELVAFPTETVYGLGADALNETAVARVFEAKGRPRFNPLIVHVARLEEAMRLGRFSAEARLLAERFWPGPLTLVVPQAAACPVSFLASAGLDSIALRMPAHPLARVLIEAAGRPLVGPSANPSGRLSPTTADDVMHGLGGRIALVLDGGPCPVGVESTVVSCLSERPVLLRPGGLPRETIEEALGRPLAAPEPSERPVSPGQLESHYAPTATLRLDAADVRPGEALLAFGAPVPAHAGSMRNLSGRGDLVEAAANLFGMLRQLDAEGTSVIAVMPVPRHGLGEAINDRLARAAAPRPAP